MMGRGKALGGGEKNSLGTNCPYRQSFLYVPWVPAVCIWLYFLCFVRPREHEGTERDTEGIGFDMS